MNLCVWSYVHVYEHVPRLNATHRQWGEVPGEQTDRAEETYLLGPLPGSPTAGTHGAFTLTGLHPLIPPCTFSMIWGLAYVKKELMWTFGPHDTCSNLPVLAGKDDFCWGFRYASDISDFLHWEACGHVNVFIMFLRWLITLTL